MPVVVASLAGLLIAPLLFARLTLALAALTCLLIAPLLFARLTLALAALTCLLIAPLLLARLTLALAALTRLPIANFNVARLLVANLLLPRTILGRVSGTRNSLRVSRRGEVLGPSQIGHVGVVLGGLAMCGGHEDEYARQPKDRTGKKRFHQLSLEMVSAICHQLPQ